MTLCKVVLAKLRFIWSRYHALPQFELRFKVIALRKKKRRAIRYRLQAENFWDDKQGAGYRGCRCNIAEQGILLKYIVSGYLLVNK